MNLAQLESLLAVVQQGSFSAAARNRFLTQPAITKHIQALERELKVRLFDRAGRRMVPTPEAHAVARRARAALGELAALAEDLAERRTDLQGTLHLGCGPVFARSVLPDAVARMRRAHPQVRFAVRECGMNEQREGLLLGDLRLGLGLHVFRDEAALAFDPILDDTLVLAVPRRHLLASAAPRALPLARIRGEPFIAFVSPRVVEEPLREAGLRLEDAAGGAESPSMRMHNTESILAMVQKGLGVALVPGYVARLLKVKGVVLRRLAEPVPLHFGSYRRRNASLTRAEQAFLAVLRTVVKRRLEHGTRPPAGVK